MMFEAAPRPSCRGLPAMLMSISALLGACAPFTYGPPPEARPEVRVSKVPGPAPRPLPGTSQAAPRSVPGPATTRGNPAFYEVFGERYYVLPDDLGYREEGLASWYGKEFDGRPTSSGEIYDMYAMTAAHKTLPLPSRVRVTNLVNQRSITVTVNDRGPFKAGRIIDLSYAAARELDIVGAGTAPVLIEALGDGNAPAKPGEAPQRKAATADMYMQVGAFGSAGNAERLRRDLQQAGVSDVVIRYDEDSTPPLYRVRIGPVASVADFDALAARLRSMRINDPRLVMEAAAPRGR